MTKYYYYKGNTYKFYTYCQIKTGFWIWRIWRWGIIYADSNGNQYVRTSKDFLKKFKPLPDENN